MGYFKLLSVYAKASFLNQLSFRFHFAINLLNSLVGFAVSLGAILFLFGHTDQVNSWDRYELIGLASMYTVIRGVLGLFLLPSLEQFVNDIVDGRYDRILLTPVNSYRHTLARSWNSMAIVDVAIGLCGIGWSVRHLHIDPTPLTLLETAVSWGAAFVICFNFLMAVSVSAFWIKRSGWNELDIQYPAFDGPVPG